MTAFIDALVLALVGVLVAQGIAVAFAIRSMRRGGGESA